MSMSGGKCQDVNVRMLMLGLDVDVIVQVVVFVNGVVVDGVVGDMNCML